jgi:hypothetical protein
MKKVKAKLSLCLINQALCHEYIWGSRGIAPSFLTSALDGGGQIHGPSALPEENAPGTHWIAGWVGR